MSNYVMGCDEVTAHLYSWRLNRVLSDDLSILSVEEIDRYQRFKHPLAATRFAAARAGLRRRLACHLRLDPAELMISQTPLGKPFLRGYSNCHFNLSHCDDDAALIIADVPVGIDLESLPKGNWLALAERILHIDEYEHWRQLPHAIQPRRLIEYWTAKESVMKACGLGFQLPFKMVQIAPDFRRPLFSPDLARQVGDQWRIELRAFSESKMLSVCFLCEQQQYISLREAR